MKSELFAVEEDGVIVNIGKLADSDIYDTYAEGGYVVIFRKTAAGIEYADVDLTYKLDWKMAEPVVIE